MTNRIPSSNGHANGKVILPIRSLADSPPPQDVEAEQYVVGAMLYALESRDPDGISLIPDVIELLAPADFFRDDYRIIFAGLVELFHAGNECDALGLIKYLESRGELAKIGGMEGVAQAIHGVPHAVCLVEHAARVRSKSRLRSMIDLSQRIIADCYGGRDGAAEIETRAITDLIRLAAENRSRTARRVEKSMDSAGELIESKQMGISRAIPSGLADLDDLFGGFRRGKLTVVAARPGLGKTSLALGVLDSLVGHPEHAGVLFSLEMDCDEVGMQMISMRGRVDSRRIERPGTLVDAEWERVRAAAKELKALRLIIEPMVPISVDQICLSVMRAAAKGEADLVIVDYLQLVDGPSDGVRRSREQEVGEITRRLRAVAQRTGAAVVVLAQLNRASESRDDKRPRLCDLRESGAIEAHADAVLLLHRPSDYDPEDKPGCAEIIVAKNRKGQRGIATVAWQGQFTRFSDYHEEIPEDDSVVF